MRRASSPNMKERRPSPFSGFPINATEEARKTFEGGFDGVRQGFKGTIDQLADYLVSQSGKSR